MRKALFLLLGLLCLNCGAAPKPVFDPNEVVPMQIRFQPTQFAQVLSTIRVYCRLPSNVGEGNFIFSIPMMFTEQGPIDRLEHERIIHVPCQSFTVICGYVENHKKPVYITRDVIPTGECDGTR